MGMLRLFLGYIASIPMALISSFNYIYVDFVYIMVISSLFTFMVITYLFLLF